MCRVLSVISCDSIGTMILLPLCTSMTWFCVTAIIHPCSAVLLAEFCLVFLRIVPIFADSRLSHTEFWLPTGNFTSPTPVFSCSPTTPVNISPSHPISNTILTMPGHPPRTVLRRRRRQSTGTSGHRALCCARVRCPGSPAPYRMCPR